MLEKLQSLLYIAFLVILIWQLVFSENSLMGKQEAMFEIDGNTYVSLIWVLTRKLIQVTLKM